MLALINDALKFQKDTSRPLSKLIKVAIPLFAAIVYMAVTTRTISGNFWMCKGATFIVV